MSGAEAPHAHDLGLREDMRVFSRRRALGLFAGAGAGVLLAACSGSQTTGSASVEAEGCITELPDEVLGPFPGNGSNGPDLIGDAAVVRRDITASIGGARGVAEGVPITLRLNVLDRAEDCRAFSGAAVYVWHCNREGRYSMYEDPVVGENYLRGLQEADGDGVVTFDTIFPGAYPGRFPHVHLQVFPSLDVAMSGSGQVKTSQFALPPQTCEAVYATAGYEGSRRDFPRTPLSSDIAFRDGSALQIPTVTGTPPGGLSASLTLAV